MTSLAILPIFIFFIMLTGFALYKKDIEDFDSRATVTEEYYKMLKYVWDFESYSRNSWQYDDDVDEEEQEEYDKRRKISEEYSKKLSEDDLWMIENKSSRYLEYAYKIG